MRSPERLAGVPVAAWAWMAAAQRVLGASPTPDALGDPRSAGEGPGLVGDPLVAVLVVVVIGVVALVATLAYVRATGGPGPADGQQ